MAEFSTKDDPLKQGPWGRRVLWLDREGMDEARKNFWTAFQEYRGRSALLDEDDAHTWDIAWAASIAAYSFVMEGRLEPKR